MKKPMIALFIILLLVGLLGMEQSVLAADPEPWDSCPRAIVDCEYPGICRAYIDTNNDNICDRSQLAPEEKTTIEKTETTDNNSMTQFEPSSDTDSDSTGAASDIDSAKKPRRSTYNLLIIVIIKTSLYMATWILSKKKIIKQQLHRKVWNLVLLISSVASAMLGFLLILNLDHSITLPAVSGVLFWHVETGIVMGLVALFHILWHWRYFAKLIKIRD